MNEEKEVVNLKELGEFGLIDRITKKLNLINKILNLDQEMMQQ